MGRVLIIDDSNEMLDMLRAFFERRTPHEVIACDNGREALQTALTTHPDVAVVDIMMPDVDGYAVVRQLRANPETKNIGIIVLTARGQPVDRQAALAAGADLHLAKPVDFPELSGVIEDLMSRTSGSVSNSGVAVVPVMCLKGGIGVTTVATNLALLMQQSGPTVLWDLSPTSGHVALFLGLQPKLHWGVYAREPQTPVDDLLLEHRSGLKVLCAPPVPSPAGWLHKEQLTAILQSLLTRQASVVIDMPPMLDDGVLALLSVAGRVVLLTGDDPPAIQSTLGTLQVLRPLSVEVLLVHNVPDPGRHPRAEDLQKVMRTPFHADLPYDPNQALVVGRGVPLALAKGDSPLVVELRDLLIRHLS